MKTLTNHDALAASLTNGVVGTPADIWPKHPDGATDVAPALHARTNETDLPMNTFAPVDELDELDPDIQRPPDDSLDETFGEPSAVRALPLARAVPRRRPRA